MMTLSEHWVSKPFFNKAEKYSEIGNFLAIKFVLLEQTRILKLEADLSEESKISTMEILKIPFKSLQRVFCKF